MHSLEERVGAATLAAPAEAIPTTDDSFSNELRSLRATPGWPFVKWAVLLGVALLCGVGSLVMGSHWAR